MLIIISEIWAHEIVDFFTFLLICLAVEMNFNHLLSCPRETLLLFLKWGDWCDVCTLIFLKESADKQLNTPVVFYTMNCQFERAYETVEPFTLNPTNGWFFLFYCWPTTKNPRVASSSEISQFPCAFFRETGVKTLFLDFAMSASRRGFVYVSNRSGVVPAVSWYEKRGM